MKHYHEVYAMLSQKLNDFVPEFLLTTPVCIFSALLSFM